MRVLETGLLESLEKFTEVVRRLTSEGLNRATVRHDGPSTHYWLVEIDGQKILYGGTPESFALWKRQMVQ